MNWSDKQIWKDSFTATFICLCGCSIGTMGTAFYLVHYHWFFVLLISLISGFTTCIGFMILWHMLFRKMNLKEAFKHSYNMSFASVFIMMFAENLVLLLVFPEDFSHQTHMQTAEGIKIMTVAMVLGFFLALPYNYYQSQKTGKAIH